MARSHVGDEAEAGEMPDRFVGHAHLAILGDAHRQQFGAALVEIAQQHRGAAIDEALGQPVVQCVGELFFQHAGAFGPVRGLGQPVGTMGDISPGPCRGDAVGERFDVALHRVEPLELVGEPARGYAAVTLAQMLEDAADQAGMMLGAGLAEIWQTAGCPQPLGHGVVAGARDGVGLGGKALEHGEVGRLGGGAEHRPVGLGLEAGDQPVDAGEIGRAAAPIEMVEWGEMMALDRHHLIGLEGRARSFRAERAEGPVALVAAGAAGDLRHLGDAQPPRAASIELAQAREGDVRDVHVEAHADGVGGDEKIDLAGLIHRDLCVARAGRKRAHHHRRAAAQPAQHLGDGVNLLGGEGDDDRALGQARELLGPGKAKRRETRPANDLNLRHQRAQHRAQRFGTEDQRLLAATGTQQPVGEDMAALHVGAELGFIERHEGEIAFGAAAGQAAARDRHALSSAEEIAGFWREDLLLAGKQGDLILALDRDDPVIDFAGQQAQRESHEAGGVAAHALDRIVGLARIRGPQHGDEPIIDHAAHPQTKVECCACEGKSLARSRDSVRRGFRIVRRRTGLISLTLTLSGQSPWFVVLRRRVATLGDGARVPPRRS